MLVEKNYQSLQEEVDDMRRLIKKFRLKYKQAVNEIKDLNAEHNKERTELFETIQDQEKDYGLHREILRNLVTEKELQKIIAKAEYDADDRKWRIPAFVIKEKQIQLPKVPTTINNEKGKEEYRKQFFEEQKSKNKIVFQDSRNPLRNSQEEGAKGRLAHSSTTVEASKAEDIQAKKSMSQTNYDRWKDFS